MNIYTIYKFTNKINGKSYVGKTNNIERRIEDHKKSSNNGEDCYFYRAVRKYGFDNFEIEILFRSTSQLISEKEFTNLFEPLLIKEHKSHKSQNGYNMTWGGEGFDSETAKLIQKTLVQSGNHHLLKREDGTSHASDKVKKRNKSISKKK